MPTDPRTPCTDDALHGNEEPGKDVLCDGDGYWRNFAEGRSFRGTVNVCAGPLVHRGSFLSISFAPCRAVPGQYPPFPAPHLTAPRVDPCIGFIFHEPASLPAPRKLAILGDTSSPAQLTHLVTSTPGRLSLLVHEATDAHIPEHVDPLLGARRSPALVASKTRERGHSTPVEAGTCAGKWGAKQLVLNHIGSRHVSIPFIPVYPLIECHDHQ